MGRVAKFVKRVVALATAAALAGTLAHALALKDVKGKLVQEGEVNAYLVLGKYDPASIAAAAVDVALALTESVKTPVSVEEAKVWVKGAEVLEGAAPLYKSTSPLKLGDALTAGGVDALKEGDLSILETKTVTDTDDKEHKIKFYIAPTSNGEISFEFNDETKYFAPILKVNGHLLDLKIVFEPSLNFSKVKGRKITLFGKEFIVSPNSDEVTSTKLVLYEGAGEVNITKGSSAELEINGKKYEFTILGWSKNGDTIYLQAKDVETGTTETEEVSATGEVVFDDLGIRVFVKEMGVMETGADQITAYVKLWKGYGKYILDASSGYIYKDKELSENRVKGIALNTTSLDFTNCAQITVKFDPREVREDLPDWEEQRVKPGEEVEVPIFGVKLIYKGPSLELKDEAKDELAVKSDGKTKLYVEYGGKRLYFAKWTDSDEGNDVDTNEISAVDAEGKEWVFVEGTEVTVDTNTGTVQEKTFYTVANPGVIDEAKIIKVVAKEREADGNVDVKIYDAITGDLLAEAEDVGPGSSKNVYIGTKQYTVSYDGTNVKIEYRDSATAVFPVVKLTKGELLVFAKPSDISLTAPTDNETVGNVGVVKIQLPTGVIYVDEYDADQATAGITKRIAYKLESGTWTDITAATEVDVGGVKYVLTPDTANDKVTIALSDQSGNAVTLPVIAIIEPKDIVAGRYPGVVVVGPVTGSSELEAEIKAVVETTAGQPLTDTDANKDYYLTKWGTYVEVYHPTTSGATNTIDVYVPEEKVYYKVYVGAGEVNETTEEGPYTIPGEVKGVEITKVEVPEAYTVGEVKLTTEVDTLPADKPAIVLGTTLGSTKVSELVGQVGKTPEAGKALVAVIGENKPVVLVAGVKPEDVVKAAEWLAKVLKGEVEGPEVEADKVLYNAQTGEAEPLVE